MPDNDCYPELVECSGDGLKFGYIYLPLYVTIDTRRAGPGELKVFCNGPEKNAICELRNHFDGTFALKVRPHDIGVHHLYVKYDGVDVPESPFKPFISPASLVQVRGPGMEHGLLSSSEKGKFTVDTKKAGRGDVKIRIGGPKGSFKMETKMEGHFVYCNYNPREKGTYVIHITWNNHELPGSPFQVYAARDEDDLYRFVSIQSEA